MLPGPALAEEISSIRHACANENNKPQNYGMISASDSILPVMFGGKMRLSSSSNYSAGMLGDFVL